MQFVIFVFALILPLALFYPYSLHAKGTFLSPGSSDKSEISKCSLHTVSRVIDGDTFELSNSNKVRLIGVDTPETNDPRTDVQWFGREASKKLKEWIEGRKVCLKEDVDKTYGADKYGRLLRYVWKYPANRIASYKTGSARGGFINAELIRQGYGFAYTRYPFEYLEDFKKYEREARENNRGLWNREKQEKWEKETSQNSAFAKTCGERQTICPEDAINHIGEYKTVRFFVKKSYDSGKAIFLNSKNNFKDYDNFTAIIFETDKNNFPPQAADFYWGKTVDVAGWIKKYKGRAEIILKDASKINKIIK
ncbi:MAG: thermonuclease family protein [Thermodesulfovibrionia bacterium]